jgi:hypothetical protein
MPRKLTAIRVQLAISICIMVVCE